MRLPQLLAHGGEHILAHAEIMRLGVGPGRHAVQRSDITGARRVARILLCERLGRRHQAVFGEIRRLRLVLMLSARAVKRRVAPQQVKQASEQRQQQDNDDPADLIGRVIIFTDKPDHDDDAQHGQYPWRPQPAPAHPAHAVHDDHQLRNQQQAADHTPVRQDPSQNSAHNPTPFSINFPV